MGHKLTTIYPTELLTPEQSHQIDVNLSKNGKIKQIMENAGKAVFREIIYHYKPCRTAILCGPGNNGGDGYVVAKLLAKQGWPVQVLTYGLPPDNSLAQQVASEWTGITKKLTLETICNFDLYVDALFGSGLNRALPTDLISILSKLQPVVAIDIPSGVDGLTGNIRNFAINAQLTISFTKGKPGQFLYPGKSHIGKLIIKDIGIPSHLLNTIETQFFLNQPGLWHIPVSTYTDYKYSRGTVTVVGGNHITGAPRLAALAAKNTGAGLVKIYPLGQSAIYEMVSPCLMIDQTPIQNIQKNHTRHCWVCGPGLLPKEVQSILPVLIKQHQKIVADAGIFHPEHRTMLKGASVLTPHRAEFERVFGQLSPDKVKDVQKACWETNSIIVLKGPDTLMISPEGKVAINDHANARLATAGSGDVLSGIIATLIAQGMNSWQASCAGVWLHGEAGFQCLTNWPDAELILSYLGPARDQLCN